MSGTVQGVFFRKFIRDKADEIRVRGFVRNLDDGRVEIIAEANDAKVNRFLDACKQGPPHAEIRDVKTEEIKHQGFDRFKILMI